MKFVDLTDNLKRLERLKGFSTRVLIEVIMLIYQKS
jgi:hypothetical protein